MPPPINDASRHGLKAFVDALRPTRSWKIVWDHREHSTEHPPYIVRTDVATRTITIETHLHRGQLAAFLSDSECHVVAGTQVGKTIVLPLWILRQILRCGPGSGLVCSPTFPLMEKKLAPELRRLFIEDLGIMVEHRGASWEFRLNELGREIVGGRFCLNVGYASNPDSLESATYKFVAADECGQKAFKRQSYDAIQRRLLENRTRGLGASLWTSTPYDTGHWWHDVCKLAECGDGGKSHVTMPTSDNAYIGADVIEERRRSMEDWRFAMMYLALWTRPLAAIFPFHTQVHCLRRVADDAGRWRGVGNTHRLRICGVDFGPLNMAAVMLVRSNVNEVWHAYATYLGHGTHEAVSTHADRILEEIHPDPRVRASFDLTVVGGAPSEDSWRDMYWEAGLPVRRPNEKSIEAHIQAIVKLLRQGRLVVFNDMGDLIKQLRDYARKLDTNGLPTLEVENDRIFHLIAALRYACSYIEYAGL